MGGKERGLASDPHVFPRGGCVALSKDRHALGFPLGKVITPSAALQGCRGIRGIVSVPGTGLSLRKGLGGRESCYDNGDKIPCMFPAALPTRMPSSGGQIWKRRIFSQPHYHLADCLLCSAHSGLRITRNQA